MENKKWFASHGDTISILTAFIIGVLWLSNSFKDLRFEMHQNIFSVKEEMNTRFNEIDKDLIMIKTSLIMKGIIPSELATTQTKETMEI